MAKEEILEALKLAFIIFLIGIPVAFAFSFITQMLAQASFLMYAVFLAIFIYAGKGLEKEWKSLWDLFVGLAALLFIQGAIVFFLPVSSTYLSWASGSFPLGLFQTLSIASLAVLIKQKFAK